MPGDCGGRAGGCVMAWLCCTALRLIGSIGTAAALVARAAAPAACSADACAAEAACSGPLEPGPARVAAAASSQQLCFRAARPTAGGGGACLQLASRCRVRRSSFDLGAASLPMPYSIHVWSRCRVSKSLRLAPRAFPPMTLAHLQRLAQLYRCKFVRAQDSCRTLPAHVHARHARAHTH